MEPNDAATWDWAAKLYISSGLIDFIIFDTEVESLYRHNVKKVSRFSVGS